MRPRGWWVIVGLAAFVGLFMAAVWVLGHEFRQEYRVASAREDAERVQLDLDGAHAVWVEQVPGGWSVVAYDIASGQRRTLEARDASPGHAVAVHGGRAAWTALEAGRRTVRVHDLAANATTSLDGPEQDAWLPGRTLEHHLLVAAGDLGGGVAGALAYDLRDGTAQALRVRGAPRPLDGTAPAWDAFAPSSPLRLTGERLWWHDGATIAAMDLAGRGSPEPFEAGGRVLGLDAHDGLVAWAEDRGLVRRVHFRSLDNGTQGEASAFPGDQHGPSVHGARIVFVQHDRLVRLKDLATGEERVLPARTQENRELRLAPDWAAWLSGTLEGHNVLLVPLRA